MSATLSPSKRPASGRVPGPSLRDLRPRIEAAIEGLIAALDATDGDPDVEPEETDQDAGEQNEIDCDLQEDDGDADGEPSLG